jgi:hypothetical protein
VSAERIEAMLARLREERAAVARAAEIAEGTLGSTASPVSMSSTAETPTTVTAETTAELLAVLVETILRYIVMTPAEALTIALWILHTHAFKAADYSPYLAVTAPEKRSGKTTVIKLLELLVANPWRVITPSEAVVYRKIDRDGPTVLLDEFDAIWSNREQEPLRAVFNAGNEPGAIVPRCAGANRDELRDFRVYCPKAFAGIGKLPATIADRCIEIRLQRKAPGEPVESFRRRLVAEQLRPIRDSLVNWAVSATVALEAADWPSVPEQLDDRAADCWEPLLALADHAGPRWAERARDAALSLSADGAREEDSIGVRLLRDIRDVFGTAEDRIATHDLLEGLNRLDEAPWETYGRGEKPLNPRRLGVLLKRYGISSRTVRLHDGTTAKGFLRAQFEDAWTRYVAQIRSGTVTPSQPASLGEKQPSPIRHPDSLVTDRNGRFLAQANGCDAVTDRTRVHGEWATEPDPEVVAAPAQLAFPDHTSMTSEEAILADLNFLALTGHATWIEPADSEHT